MATMDEYVDSQFLSFLEDLCAHIQTAGGVGNANQIRKQSLEEVYKNLRPNGIIIGFRNIRMLPKYQLSYQMKSEVVYGDREDEID